MILRRCLFEGKFVKANKEHTCYECKGIIEKGERYFRTWGIWEGKHSNFKSCHDCEDLRDEINQDDSEYRKGPDEMVPFGDLEEYIRESDEEERMKNFKIIQEERRKKD